MHPAASTFYWSEFSVSLNKEDYEAARAKADELRADLPDDPDVQSGVEFVLGGLARTQGRLEEGIDHARAARAMIRRQHTVAGRYDWATAWVTLEERADTAGAVRFVEGMLVETPLEQFDPLDRPYFGFVSFFGAAGEGARARELLAAFLEAVPDAPESRWEDDELAMEADLALTAGRYDEAIEHWLRYREIEGGCVLCGLEQIARAHDEAGRHDEAIEWYRRYIEVPFTGRPPNRARTFERLGQLYDEAGDLDNAALYYARFVELWSDADEELQPRVRVARTRLDEILRERG